ncbi:hypothetical protein [Pseudobutyrivibrio sp.]|uniref:hypothetical protein n=1 Tax=Pseudobutyrivibrio sp. TaxID=2014367 RepID=UPI001DC19354|nr:hypothetical protein [Pseudobutyrivibrio sp.]MBE5910603.1 hypothetical protein [Pseudobutyrivibrio sp.]
MNTYLQSQYANAAKQAAEETTKSIGKITADSSKEEVTEAVKSFETYMMEQVLKQMKESFVDENDEEEDNSISMYKDFFMDKMYSEMASQIVDQVGDNITEDFVDQIMRNYGITGTTNLPLEDISPDDASVSEDIAKENTNTVTGVLA